MKQLITFRFLESEVENKKYEMRGIPVAGPTHSEPTPTRADPSPPPFPLGLGDVNHRSNSKKRRPRGRAKEVSNEGPESSLNSTHSAEKI
ncbi:hypothetical protein NPIL_411281 [Nephila pilipes]|uniref:Uncharacterized protein n=1 Tax=Nephila pilipes TaxID=299642 RepID=A0A8X6MGE2_NEPPI|nr:hypothetical protein NPIL_411281 [Nephila pilipes]